MRDLRIDWRGHLALSCEAFCHWINQGHFTLRRYQAIFFLLFMWPFQMWRERVIGSYVRQLPFVLLLLCGFLGGFCMVSAHAEVPRIMHFSYNILDAENQPGKVLAALQQLSDTWVAQPADAEHITTWSRGLSDVLRSVGYPIGQVIVMQADAEQAERSQNLRFSVYLGAIGRLDLHNTSRVNDERLLSTVRNALCDAARPVEQGCVLESSRLERATQLVQDIPGVTLAGAPALDAANVGTGQTHLTMETIATAKPWTAGLTSDNQGSQVTGLLRLGANASGNNLFGAGDAYNASLYTSNKHMWSGTAGASAPLGYNGLRWSVAAARSLYTIDQGVLLDSVGNTLSAGLTYPFIRGLDMNLNGALDVVDTSTSTTYPDFGLNVSTKLHSLRATLSGNNGDRAQQLGLSQWQASAAVTLGDQANNDAQDIGPQRAGHYAKLAASVVRRQNVTDSGALFALLNVRGQLANKNLDYSEMLSLGGLAGVRAYRSDEGSVNQGVLGSLDLKWRLPAPDGGQILPGLLLDAATGQLNRNPWTGWQAGYPTVRNVSNHRFLADYGVTLDWVTPSGFTISVVWARRFPFSGESWVAPGSANSRIWLTLAWQH